MFTYLRPEDIRQLKSFQFAPRAVAEGYLAGAHASRAAGSSTEFRGHRPYTPGDDPKAVDWRVFARTDRHYLRTYEKETNTDCYILLDSSASMGFGEPLNKLAYASFFAAALAYLVVRNTDLVALQLFDQDIRAFYPPGSTTAHLHGLLHALEANRPGNETRLGEALRRSVPLLKRRGTLVVISDFFDDPAAVFDALNPYLHRGFQIHLFHVLDPAEIDLGERGLLSFQDLETGERITAHTGVIAEAYRAALDTHIARLRELSTRRQIHYGLARTDRNFLHLFDQLVSK